MITELDGVPVTHRRVRVRTTGIPGGHHDLGLHVVTAGPEDGTPVICLHGFPDFWLGWRRQIPALARAGYRVIVPDQRGYGTSDKPPATSAYDLRHLLQDVVGLQDALCGGAPTHIVGHDWGGGVAWSLAMARPDRVRTLTVANCPPPRVLMKHVRSSPRQLLKSWYIVFFQIPGVAERLLSRGGVEKLLGELDRRAPHAFPDDIKALYGEAATFEAMQAALRWYRAAARSPGPRAELHLPVLLLWGDRDVALGSEMAEPSLAHCTDGRLQWLPGISHWSPHEAYEAVNEALLGQLANHGGTDPYVYKIVGPDWDPADGAWTGSTDDHRDGFIHLSAGHQVQGTLDKHFAGQTGLRVLTVDPQHLPTGALVWEESRGGKRFPHLYAPLTADAVVAIRPVD